VVAALGSVPLSEIASLSGALGRLGQNGIPAAARPAVAVVKKRRVLNYPKCAWPGCTKNRSPRTIPYCGEHFRANRAGETPPAVAATDDGNARSAAAGKARGGRAKARARKKAS
jgi:hypothetical protein